MPRFTAIVVLASLLAFYGNDLPDRMWSAYVPILLLLCRYSPAWRLPLLLAATYLWCTALLHYHLDHRLIEAYDNRVSLLHGRIADLPESGNGRVRLYVDEIEIRGYPGPAPRLLRLNWYQETVLPRPGERWQFQVKLRQPRGLSNPAGFDFAAWQFSHGVDAVGYIRNSPLNRRLESARAWQIDNWRMRLAANIDDYCSGCAHRGLIKALALGFRGDIAKRDARLLRDSASAHLLAISGMHIGLVAWLAFACGRLCWRSSLYAKRLNRVESATLFAVAAAFVYAALAGFSLPTVRALVMLGVLCCALLLRQRPGLMQSLSIALAAILLADPRAIGSSSLWLSAGALLVIGFACFRLPPGLAWWRQLLYLQCFFTLLFAPLSAFIFGQFTPAGLPANLVAIPLVSFAVLPVVLLACLLSAAGPFAAAPLLRLADRVLGLLLDYLEWLLGNGLAAIPGDYPGALMLIALVLTAWAMLPRGPGTRLAALTGIGMLLLWQPQRPGQGEFEMIVFDVGMGTSVLLQTRHHSLVYDFGPGRPGVFSAADWALLPALRKRRIGSPDLAVVSHVDQDHSGGLTRLLQIDADLPLVSGTPLDLRSRFNLARTPRSCHDYPGWRWDGVSFRFLPLSKKRDSTNNRSCVLRVQGHHRVLLPGDIEFSRELELVENHAGALQAEVLVVPHHGSATSSSAKFIRQVAPHYAIFTLSRGNRWGFPSAAVGKRYVEAGAELLRSDLDGAVSLKSTAAGLELRAEAVPLRRIWRRW